MNLTWLIIPSNFNFILCSISMLLMSSNFPLKKISSPLDVPITTVSPLKVASMHVIQALLSNCIHLLGFFLALVQMHNSPFSPPVTKFYLFKAATHSIDLCLWSKRVYFPSSIFNIEALQS